MLWVNIEKSMAFENKNIRRGTAWFSEYPYRYGRVLHKANTQWPTFLKQLNTELSRLMKYSFNSVLLNYYRNGKDVSTLFIFSNDNIKGNTKSTIEYT